MNFDQWKRRYGTHKWRRETDADAVWCSRCMASMNGEQIVSGQRPPRCEPTEATIAAGTARLRRESAQLMSAAHRIADKLRVPVREVLAAWEEQP